MSMFNNLDWKAKEWAQFMCFPPHPHTHDHCRTKTSMYRLGTLMQQSIQNKILFFP